MLKKKKLRESYDSYYKFADLKDVAVVIEGQCTLQNIKIEESRQDYCDNVRCIRLYTENLNPLYISNLHKICENFMDSYPDVAIEIEESKKYGYFYGREICIMLASEYYID